MRLVVLHLHLLLQLAQGDTTKELEFPTRLRGGGGVEKAACFKN